MKKRPYPGQQIPAVATPSNSGEEGATPSMGDELVKGVICKVCERKFQMHLFWHKEAPPLEQREEEIRQAYTEHKRKIKELEGAKKECQDQRQELVSIGTQRLNHDDEKRADREQMEDLVGFAKSNVEKIEKRI